MRQHTAPRHIIHATGPTLAVVGVTIIMHLPSLLTGGC